MGLVTLIQQDVSVADQRKVLEGIDTSTKKLDLVVRELINILNIRNQATEKRTKVSLTEIVDEIKEKSADLIATSKAEICCDFSGVATIYSIRSYIYNIIYNIVVNSMKYRSPDRTPVVDIKAVVDGDKILITIADNGIGIDLKKYGDQMFLLNRRFYNTIDGKGLGLFMTKIQVDALNGYITLDSHPGIGTTVFLSLPEY
jgi:signal transduction histidine kinase